MTTIKNESKILAKDESCECKGKFDGRKYNSNQKWNNDKCQDECKKHHICEKDYIWNPATCSCKNGNYLASVIDHSVVTSDEIIDAEEKKAVTTSFNEKKSACKTRNVYILVAFLLITIALLIAVSIYCYLIKYQVKQKCLLPFHNSNNKFKKFCINNVLKNE